MWKELEDLGIKTTKSKTKNLGGSKAIYPDYSSNKEICRKTKRSYFAT